MPTLVKTVKETFKAGQIIFNQGEIGDKIYIIETGRVSIDVVIDENTRFNWGEFGPKDFFGEMSMFSSKTRTGTARAIEDTTVITFNQQVIKNQMSKLPSWFYTMFVALIERLRKTDERLIAKIIEEMRTEQGEQNSSSGNEV